MSPTSHGTFIAVEVEESARGDAELASPMPGSVVAVGVADGESIDAGVMVVAVEAMKMEHSLRAPVAGTVELLVAVGDQVTRGQALARIVTTGPIVTTERPST